MADFAKRWLEQDVLALVQRGEELVNTCKNGLGGTNTSVLDMAATISAADLTRMNLDADQKAALQADKAKFQAVYDAIIAQGF